MCWVPAALTADVAAAARRCLLMLHMWMLIHRLSADGDMTRALRQELYDLFQEDVEVRVRQEVQVRVASTVTDLEKSFYGIALALDRVRLHRRRRRRILRKLSVDTVLVIKCEVACALAVQKTRQMDCSSPPPPPLPFLASEHRICIVAHALSTAPLTPEGSAVIAVALLLPLLCPPRLNRCPVQALQGEEPLWVAIHRNVYGGDDDKQGAAKLLTAYILRYAPRGSPAVPAPSTLPCPLHLRHRPPGRTHAIRPQLHFR